ncbi:hypothetical protein ACFE04_010565 [Oxalis oulophora]
MPGRVDDSKCSMRYGRQVAEVWPDSGDMIKEDFGEGLMGTCGVGAGLGWEVRFCLRFREEWIWGSQEVAGCGRLESSAGAMEAPKERKGIGVRWPIGGQSGSEFWRFGFERVPWGCVKGLGGRIVTRLHFEEVRRWLTEEGWRARLEKWRCLRK